MKWHKLEPFNYFYCLATEEEIKAWAKRKKVTIEDFPENVFGSAFISGSYAFLYLNPKKNANSWDAIGTIIHESVHIFQGCMKWVGEGDIGHEMEAYSIEAISINLLKDYHNAVHSQREVLSKV